MKFGDKGYDKAAKAVIALMDQGWVQKEIGDKGNTGLTQNQINGIMHRERIARGQSGSTGRSLKPSRGFLSSYERRAQGYTNYDDLSAFPNDEVSQYLAKHLYK